MDTLPVIFRADKDTGEVVAVFPTEITYPDGCVTCYVHVGQHGPCSRGYYLANTRPASPEEYGPLLEELRSIYETGEDRIQLRLIRRWPSRRA